MKCFQLLLISSGLFSRAIYLSESVLSNSFVVCYMNTELQVHVMLA